MGLKSPAVRECNIGGKKMKKSYEYGTRNIIYQCLMANDLYWVISSIESLTLRIEGGGS